MPTKDISRHLFQPKKRFTGVRMQQGRVLTDADVNEWARIVEEQTRRTLVDVVGRRGTPNDGFRVSALRDAAVPLPDGTTADGFDFDVGNGSYFLGGLRVEAEGDAGHETFLGQPDWLQLDAGAPPLPRRPTPAELAQLPGNVRHDAVFLRAWEQPVSQTEDAELKERALGGPDTAGRVRRMRRVEIASGVPEGCAAAFAQVVAGETAPLLPDTGAPHPFDAATGELGSKARLSVAFVGGQNEDPCKPALRAGFLGAENETLRVELFGSDRFMWGRDNASPLYRVTVESVNGQLTRVRFLTAPRDQAAQPLKGQAVELLPWGSLLPNGQKVAEAQGHLSSVASSYDPETQTLTLRTPLPAAWTAWQALHPGLDSAHDEPARYFYLRLWTGVSADPDDPTTHFTPATAVPLGHTGLELRFSDFGRRLDHWIVAARPHTPDVVVPWELLAGAPPVGPRMFLAPLATIRWSAGAAGAVVGELHDCRDVFVPLDELRGCCTVTVGDGETSRGQVQSIQQAIDLLPQEGGKVCLLPGRFRQRFRIAGRRNVTIEGCGARSVIANPPDEDGYRGSGAEPPPLVEILGSTGVTLKSFAVEATGLFGVTFEPKSSELDLVDLRFEQLGAPGEPGVMPLSAIEGVADGVRIVDCRLRMDDRPSVYPCVYVGGRHVRVLRNLVAAGRATTVEHDQPYSGEIIRAWAGLQVAGGTRDILIEDNDILGGVGHGIALGDVFHVIRRDDGTVPFDQRIRHPIGRWGITRLDLCDEIVVFPPPITPPEGPTAVPVPGEPLTDVRIIDNRIAHHGASGISVAGFFADASILITDLLIEANDIGWNVLVAPPVRRPPIYWLQGGIALALVRRYTLRDNRIVSNGVRHPGAVVGAGVMSALAAVIEGNDVRDNGGAAAGATITPSLRGGLFVGSAVRDLVVDDKLTHLRGTALVVRGNRVVQRHGRALWVRAGSGPMQICDNLLESHGDEQPEAIAGWSLQYGRTGRPAVGVCVQVLTISLPREVLPSSSVDNLIEWFLDGGIEFRDNHTVLRWRRAGGAGASVLLVSALDRVDGSQNHMVVDMGGDRLDAESDLGFLGHVASAHPSLANRSFLLYHAVAVGTSVDASHNRLIEGRTDAAASMLSAALGVSGPILVANASVYNHATHCVYVSPPGSDDVGNRVLISPHGCQVETPVTAPIFHIQPPSIEG